MDAIELQTKNADAIAEDVDAIIDSAFRRAGVDEDAVWLRKSVLAKILDCTPRTIERSRQFRCLREGGRVLYPVSDIRKYLRQRLVGEAA